MTFLYDDPCILIGGAPRSGTTLLRAMIAAHPDAAVLLEERLTDVVLAVERLASIRAPEEEGARAGLFGGARSFLAVPWNGGESEIERLALLPGYSGRFSRLFRETFAAACGRRAPTVLGSKLPISSLWENVDLLDSRLRDLRIVFIVRNPLDVISSSLVRAQNARRGLDEWPIQNVEGAYAQWLHAMRRMADIAAARYAPVLTLKYEDVQAQPAEARHRLLTFAGLDPDAPGFDDLVIPSKNVRAGLTADDLEFLRRHLGEIDLHWPSLSAERAMYEYAQSTPFLEAGDEIAIGDQRAEPFLASGFSFPEPWGRWTDGDTAILRFRHDVEPRVAYVVLQIALVRPGPVEGEAPLRICVNDGAPISLNARAGTPVRIDLTPEDMSRQTISIAIRVVHPKQADDPPVEDRRRLGVGIASLRFH